MKYEKILKGFRESYNKTLSSHGFDPKEHAQIFDTFLELIQKNIEHPYEFSPFHQTVRHPFDYYQFGIEFFRPLVDEAASTVAGETHLERIETFLSRKENVILFANHQIEADPQAISLLLEKRHPRLAEQMIFVAGERVITDPLAIPFSMGRNLLCIYSKRYIDNPPEQKADKQRHNSRTMQLMSDLLKEGGKCIYVAPSGGRDRPGKSGVVELAPFDGQNIEMFYLMAKKAKTPTHFFPMALSTYDLLPPPETIQTELGEERSAKRGDIHLAMGGEIDMEKFPGSDHLDKHARRKARADYIYELVKSDYKKINIS